MVLLTFFHSGLLAMPIARWLLYLFRNFEWFLRHRYRRLWDGYSASAVCCCAALLLLLLVMLVVVLLVALLC